MKKSSKLCLTACVISLVGIMALTSCQDSLENQESSYSDTTNYSNSILYDTMTNNITTDSISKATTKTTKKSTNKNTTKNTTGTNKYSDTVSDDSYNNASNDDYTSDYNNTNNDDYNSGNNDRALYQEELQVLNAEYEETKQAIETERIRLEAQEQTINRALENLGISYLQSSTYYANQKDSIMTQIRDLTVQKAYASASEQSSLQRRIDSLTETYKTYYACESYAADMELIKQGKEDLDIIESQAAQTYQSKLSQLKNKYGIS